MIHEVEVIQYMRVPKRGLKSLGARVAAADNRLARKLPNRIPGFTDAMRAIGHGSRLAENASRAKPLANRLMAPRFEGQIIKAADARELSRVGM